MSQRASMVMSERTSEDALFYRASGGCINMTLETFTFS